MRSQQRPADGESSRCAAEPTGSHVARGLVMQTRPNAFGQFSPPRTSHSSSVTLARGSPGQCWCKGRLVGPALGSAAACLDPSVFRRWVVAAQGFGSLGNRLSGCPSLSSLLSPLPPCTEPSRRGTTARRSRGRRPLVAIRTHTVRDAIQRPLNWPCAREPCESGARGPPPKQQPPTDRYV